MGLLITCTSQPLLSKSYTAADAHIACLPSAFIDARCASVRDAVQGWLRLQSNLPGHDKEQRTYTSRHGKIFNQ